MSRRKVLFIGGLLLAIICIIVVVKALFGYDNMGVAESIEEVPYVGQFAEGLTTESEVQYYLSRGLRGTRGVIAGQALLPDIEGFIASHDLAPHNRSNDNPYPATQLSERVRDDTRFVWEFAKEDPWFYQTSTVSIGDGTFECSLTLVFRKSHGAFLLDIIVHDWY